MEIFNSIRKQVKEFEPAEFGTMVTEADLKNKNIEDDILKNHFRCFKANMIAHYCSGSISKKELYISIKQYKERFSDIKKVIDVELMK